MAKRKRDIQELFRLLQKNHPSQESFERFGKSFKKFTRLKSYQIRHSNSTVKALMR